MRPPLTAGSFAGQYVIFDLPVFSLVQRYYLASHGWKVMSLSEHADDFVARAPGVYTCNDAPALLALLESRGLEGEANGSNAGSGPEGLFVAMWSLAEAPAEARAPFEALLVELPSVLLGFRDTWGGIDNRAFVRRLAARRAPRHGIPGGSARAGRSGAGVIVALPREISEADSYWISYAGGEAEGLGAERKM